MCVVSGEVTQVQAAILVFSACSDSDPVNKLTCTAQLNFPTKTTLFLSNSSSLAKFFLMSHGQAARFNFTEQNGGLEVPDDETICDDQ